MFEDINQRVNEIVALPEKDKRIRHGIELHNKMCVSAEGLRIMQLMSPAMNMNAERLELLALVQRLLTEAFDIPIKEEE